MMPPDPPQTPRPGTPGTPDPVPPRVPDPIPPLIPEEDPIPPPEVADLPPIGDPAGDDPDVVEPGIDTPTDGDAPVI